MIRHRKTVFVSLQDVSESLMVLFMSEGTMGQEINKWIDAAMMWWLEACETMGPLEQT